MWLECSQHNLTTSQQFAKKFTELCCCWNIVYRSYMKALMKEDTWLMIESTLHIVRPLVCVGKVQGKLQGCLLKWLSKSAQQSDDNSDSMLHRRWLISWAEVWLTTLCCIFWCDIFMGLKIGGQKWFLHNLSVWLQICRRQWHCSA